MEHRSVVLVVYEHGLVALDRVCQLKWKVDHPYIDRLFQGIAKTEGRPREAINALRQALEKCPARSETRGRVLLALARAQKVLKERTLALGGGSAQAGPGTAPGRPRDGAGGRGGALPPGLATAYFIDEPEEGERLFIWLEKIGTGGHWTSVALYHRAILTFAVKNDPARARQLLIGVESSAACARCWAARRGPRAA